MLDKNLKDTAIPIPEHGTWPASVHELDEPSWWAINGALTSKRPLLLRGLPGTGKSQLARAAAAALGRVFLPIVVNARMESQDLLYEYDAVQRLADAQTAALTVTDEAGGKQAKADLEPAHYIRPKPLWWGLDWDSALAMKCGDLVPSYPPEVSPDRGAVVLIDEIDKADLDLPNGLLEILGNGGFSVPIIGREIVATKVFPLVVVTTNEDRELPPAFVRRCLVHHLKLPEDPDELKARMVHRGGLHFPNLLPRVLEEAADMLVEDRRTAPDPQFVPGQAEYLDVLRALDAWGDDGAQHMEILAGIRRYTFGKYADED